MKTTQTKISFNDLGMLIGAFYFNDEDGRFENTEDLIDFLMSDERSDTRINM